MTDITALGSRFIASVDFNAGQGCWEWTGPRTGSGYGRWSSNGQHMQAHRYSYQALVSPTTPGTVIDHCCFNRRCVNPSHLREVCYKQNSEHRSGPNSNSASGIRGVSWHAIGKKWIVMVGHAGKSYYGGLFTDIDEAASVAQRMRSELFTHDDGMGRA